MSDYALVSTVELHGWLEGWQWHMAEDLDRGDEAAAELDAVQIEGIEAELSRRKRLVGKPGAPSYNDQHPWPRERFQRVKNAIRLEDYAQQYCFLLRPQWRGRNLWACCPLPEHREATPSFKINVERQRWHCFGCRGHGDVIDLVIAMGLARQVTAAVEVLEVAYNLEPWAVPKVVTENRTVHVVEMPDGSLKEILAGRNPGGVQRMQSMQRM